MYSEYFFVLVSLRADQLKYMPWLNKKRKENVRKMWNKKKQNLNQRSKQPAINRIQRMRGLGVENKQMYIRRIKESKNVDKILREASKRNVILRL